jgi:hypothetical protein
MTETLYLDDVCLRIIPNDISPTLKKLIISYNKITKIENLPGTLERFDIAENKITKIENLPASLKKFEIESNTITKIENLPTSLEVLNIDFNRITKIENLPASLKVLNISSNEITKIENLPPTLEELIIINNRITKIENLPASLKVLIISNNRITKIENLPASLEELCIDSTQITKIENLPPTLKILHIDFNKITKIENLPATLEELYISYNSIKELPLELLELRNLRDFDYMVNPIEIIPPVVQRWLENLNRRVTNNNKVYNDSQNIHNSTIQKTFRNSLSSLFRDPVESLKSFDTIREEIIGNDTLTEDTKREILNYFDDNTVHSVYEMNYKEVFQYVWSRIQRHTEFNELYKRINQEISDGLCMCFTGRLTRLLNVLVGYYEDIELQISDSEQITNIILMLQEKYEGEELKEKIKVAMEERGYSQEVINEWLEYI